MLRRIVCGVLGFAVLAVGLGVVVGARDVRKSGAYWPQWRGPARDDVSQDKGLMKEWPEGGPPLAWTGTGLGDGYSSVVIDNGRIYTAGDRKDYEYLVCLDDRSGREIWSKRIGERWKDGGSRSTPTTDSDFVFALSPHGDLVCMAASDGAEVWRKNLSKDFGGKMMSGWGFSESPLIDRDRVVCTPGADGAALAALDRKTGKEIWRAKIENCGGAGY